MLQAIRPNLFELMAQHNPDDKEQEWYFGAIGAAACYADDMIEQEGKIDGGLILCRKGMEGSDAETWI